MKKVIVSLLCIALLSCSLAVFCGCDGNAELTARIAELETELDEANAVHGNYTDEMKINDGVDLDPNGGADSYGRCDDHPGNPYFSDIDFYNLKSSDTLTMLTGFKTYQQTNEYSCGVCASLMVLEYLGVRNGLTEETLCTYRNQAKDYNELTGTALGQIVNIFDNVAEVNNVEFNTASTYDFYNTQVKEDGTKLFDENGGANWEYIYDYIWLSTIEDYLKNGMPVIVGWCDWGGHWEVIIGYDNMGTPDNFGDDVLIVADSYDTSDQNQDGYGIYGAERFYYMWTLNDFCHGLGYTNESDFLFFAVDLAD